MKKLFLILIVFALVKISFADMPFNEANFSLPKSGTLQDYTFSAGDTTWTVSVNSAKAVFITIIDSSATGTDSVSVTLKSTATNGVIGYSTISVHLLATTTTTTFIASTLLIAGDNTTGTWVWYPAGVGGTASTYSGSLFIRRLNGVNVAYTQKTHVIVESE